MNTLRSILQWALPILVVFAVIRALYKSPQSRSVVLEVTMTIALGIMIGATVIGLFLLLGWLYGFPG